MADMLQTILIGDLVARKGPLVSVPDTATVQEVLTTLVTHNITAVPVSGSAGHPNGDCGGLIPEDHSNYIGIVSVLDVVSHIADNLGQPQKELGILAVNIIGQSSDSRALWTLAPSARLQEALEPLCKGIHRFLVRMDGDDAGFEANKSGPRDCLLTQTDIIRFFLKNLDHLGPVLSKTVADLGCLEVGQSPMAVPLNMPLVDVLRVMRQEGGLTAIAVVGDMDGISPGSHPRPVRGGKIVGTISAGDFRGIKHEMLKNLTEVTVGQFLRSTGNASEPLLACHPNTTLATVMEYAVSSKAHKVWVTNEDGWLCGVVKFPDMIKAISEVFKIAVANT